MRWNSLDSHRTTCGNSTQIGMPVSCDTKGLDQGDGAVEPARYGNPGRLQKEGPFRLSTRRPTGPYFVHLKRKTTLTSSASAGRFTRREANGRIRVMDNQLMG